MLFTQVILHKLFWHSDGIQIHDVVTFDIKLEIEPNHFVDTCERVDDSIDDGMGYKLLACKRTLNIRFHMKHLEHELGPRDNW